MFANSKPKVVKAIRKLRHYKQRFRPGARFVWRSGTSVVQNRAERNGPHWVTR